MKKDKLVIIIHGSKEYRERYEHFISFLEDNSIDTHFYSLPAHDIHYNGEYYVDDYQYMFTEINDIVNSNRDKYNEIILFGHSLGSLISMNYEINYPNTLDKLILSGTTYPTSKFKFIGGRLLVKTIIKLRGKHYKSQLIENIVFQGFVNKMKRKYNSSEWLSSNDELNKKFSESKYRSEIFTVSFHKMLVELSINLYYSHFTVKTLIVTGSKDPVSNFTKSIDELQKHFTNATRIDYKESRHEILNDSEQEIVMNDILKFINS